MQVVCSESVILFNVSLLHGQSASNSKSAYSSVGNRNCLRSREIAENAHFESSSDEFGSSAWRFGESTGYDRVGLMDTKYDNIGIQIFFHWSTTVWSTCNTSFLRCKACSKIGAQTTLIDDDPHLLIATYILKWREQQDDHPLLGNWSWWRERAKKTEANSIENDRGCRGASGSCGGCLFFTGCRQIQ